MKSILSLIFTLTMGVFNIPLLHAQQMKTLVYYEDDSTKLELDLFLPKQENEQKYPVVLFVHGGGFASGDRSSGHTFAKYLATKGIVSASISYELYMKDQSFSCDGILSEKIKAIQYAVNDLWLATTFLLNQQETFNINPDQFFIAGSSAGAETVLHAAYWDYEQINWYDQKLPNNFQYAGVISGAGAIMDLNLISSESALPTFLFHGTDDNLVPYGTAAHHFCAPDSPGWLMFFGSHSIYEHLLGLNKNTTLITFEQAGHEKSATLFFEELDLIHQFLLECIERKSVQKHIKMK